MTPTAGIHNRFTKNFQIGLDRSHLVGRKLAATLPRGNNTDGPDCPPKNNATSDNFDDKAEKPLEPVTTFQLRDLLWFALRLEPAILTIEQTEQCKLAAVESTTLFGMGKVPHRHQRD